MNKMTLREEIELILLEYVRKTANEEPLNRRSIRGIALDQLEKIIMEREKEAIEKTVNQILAILAVEVMEMTLEKCDDLYCQGHIHGVNRSIYLVKDIFVPEITAKTFRIYPHISESLEDQQDKEVKK